MKADKIIRTAVVIALTAAMLFTMCACGGSKSGGSGSSEKETLESYLNAHPDIIQDVKDGITESEEVQDELQYVNVDVYAKDNAFCYDYTWKEQLTQDQIDKVGDGWENSLDALEPKMKNLVSALSSQTGIKGISAHIYYRNNDGSILAEREYTE